MAPWPHGPMAPLERRCQCGRVTNVFMDHEVAQLAGFDPFFSASNQVQSLGSGEVVDGRANGLGQPLQQTGKKFVAQRVLKAPEAGDERIDSLPVGTGANLLRFGRRYPRRHEAGGAPGVGRLDEVDRAVRHPGPLCKGRGRGSGRGRGGGRWRCRRSPCAHQGRYRSRPTANGRSSNT
jgi:hypothetical protein